MKLSKRIFAAAAALCMTAAVTACSGSSSAPDSTTTKAPETTASTEQTVTTEETTAASTTTTEAPLPDPVDGAITFDTPSLYGVRAGDDDGAAKVNFDIVDLDGNKKLRVQVLDKNDKDEYNIPKIIFDLPDLLGEDNIGKIGKITLDFTCVARDVWHNADGTDSLVVGNFLGAVCGNLASAKGYDKEGNLIQNNWGQSKSDSEFSYQDWDNPTHSWHFEVEYPLSKLPSNNYASKDMTYYDKDGNEVDIANGQTLFIMRWAQKNQVDLYLDNLTFYDKDGKVMEIIYDAAGNPAEVKQDTMKVEVPESGTAAQSEPATTAASSAS